MTKNELSKRRGFAVGRRFVNVAAAERRSKLKGPDITNGRKTAASRLGAVDPTLVGGFAGHAAAAGDVAAAGIEGGTAREQGMRGNRSTYCRCSSRRPGRRWSASGPSWGSMGAGGGADLVARGGREAAIGVYADQVVPLEVAESLRGWSSRASLRAGARDWRR